MKTSYYYGNTTNKGYRVVLRSVYDNGNIQDGLPVYYLSYEDYKENKRN